MTGGNPYIVPGLTKESEVILNYFSEHYNSIRTYVNALRRVCEITKKYNFPDFTYDDYTIIKQQFTGTNYKCSTTFFRFLYANDKLVDDTGFDSGVCFWDKQYWKGYFEKKRLDKSKKESNEEEQEEYIPSLNFEQIDKLLAFMNKCLEDDTNFENIRMAYCINAIFYSKMSVNTVKKIDAKNFNKGKITTIEGTYDIPPEYWDMFMYYKNRTYAGFTILNEYIDKLGKIVGVDNMVPQHILTARNQNLWHCGECGVEYLSFTENWKSINGRFVCNNCAKRLLYEDVKKNLILDKIENTEIDLITEKEHKKIEHHTLNFDKLRNKLKAPCDFDSWNAYLEEIGNLGQKYVVEQEKLKLLEAGLYDLSEQVSEGPANNHTNGYDVLSYTLEKKVLHIEVKATPGSFIQPFYLSENERLTAEQAWCSGINHEIHRVYNIQSGKVDRIIYKNFNDFHFENIVYKISLKEG